MHTLQFTILLLALRMHAQELHRFLRGMSGDVSEGKEYIGGPAKRGGSVHTAMHGKLMVIIANRKDGTIRKAAVFVGAMNHEWSLIQ